MADQGQKPEADQVNMSKPAESQELRRQKKERLAREAHVRMCELRGFDPDDTTGGPA